MIRILKTTFLLFFYTLLIKASFFSDISRGQQIELFDDLVVPEQPTYDSESQFRKDMERKKRNRMKREQKYAPPKKTYVEKQTDGFVQDLLKKRSDVLHMAIWTVQPLASVAGPRSNYVYEPAVIITTNYRLTQSGGGSRYQVWWGGRIAGFSGTGIYKNLPGRFGFMNFGPMISLGRIDPPPASIAGSGGAKKGKSKDVLESRESTFFSLGLSLQSRFAVYDKSAEEPDEDFNEKRFAYDSPGLWGEVHHNWVHFGGLSVGLMAGIQTGREKTLLYFGAGIGGVY
jgi:hypothetical protein